MVGVDSMTLRIQNPSVVSGVPVIGGVANEVLYANSSGNLAQSANLIFNGTTLKAATGVAIGNTISSPRGIFDVNNQNTVGNVASGSATQIDGGFNLPANGNTYQWNIYAYVTVAGVKYFSSVPFLINVTDDGSSNQFYWELDWSAVAGASGYYIVVVEDDYNGFAGYYLDAGNVLTSNYGDGTEFSYIFPTPSLPSTYGPNLYVNSSTGKLTQTGDMTVTGILDTVNITPSSGTLDIFIATANTCNYHFGLQSSTIFRQDLHPSQPTNVFDFVNYANTVAFFKMFMQTDGSPTIGFGFQPSYRISNGASHATNRFIILTGGQTGISTVAPTAMLHLPAGTTAASKAPLKLTTGTNMTTAEAGAMEYSTPDLFFTPGSAIRYNLPLVTGAGTQGDLIYASGASIYSRLAKNTTASRYLSNSGTSNNPAWAQVDLTNGVTGTLPVGNGGTGSAVKNQDNVALTNQGADITTTNFASGGVAGTYRVSYSLQDTTSDITAGAVTLTIAYTDGAGATTTTANQVLTGTGRTSGSIYLQLASGNVTYAVAHTGIFGSAKYALYLTLERLS